MEKTARKPSADPVQERLRQNKANWNKEVSALVNDLIHFKKMMNGWPSKFFKERTRITEPIPADPATIIGSLAGDFQDIVNKGNSLIQEQLNYSKTRRRKQPKPAGPAPGPTPTAPAAPEAPQAPASPDLSQQLGKGLAADDQSYYLISEASNPLSRFFARLLSPGIGGSEAARIRKYRMSLLNSTLQSYKDLKKLQAAIVGSGPQSIFVASKLLDKVESNWVFLSSGFRAYQEALPGGAANTGGAINLPSSVRGTQPTGGAAAPTSQFLGIPDSHKEAVIAALQDIQKYANTFAGVPGMPDLIEIAKTLKTAPANEQTDLTAPFLTAYRTVLVNLSRMKNIAPQKSFADVIAAETKSQSSTSPADDQLQAVAQGFLGKLRHQLSPFDKTSAFRLDIYKLANETRKLLDKIMDSLAKGLNVEELTPAMNEVGSNMLKMRTMMGGLSSTIRGQGYQPQFINMLERGRLGDYGVDLNPKQKADLERMLKQKQLRDITKMYGK